MAVPEHRMITSCPYLLPLARQNRLIFIDERGSGRSEKLDEPERLHR